MTDLVYEAGRDLDATCGAMYVSRPPGKKLPLHPEPSSSGFLHRHSWSGTAACSDLCLPPSIAVHRIVLDSKGFLWFCTNEGISRFDGFEFVNYGTRHGLPEPNANDLLETADGVYWVGTDGGLCRFANTPKRRSDKMEHKLISPNSRLLQPILFSALEEPPVLGSK